MSTLHPKWRSFLWAARLLQVRLRFLAVLVVAFLVVGQWDVIRTYWDRLTAPAARDADMGAISENTEYFCPMDPGVLSEWPGKCSVCNMALVRRSKGDMSPLPNGVVSRVQFSPERVLLGGIRTLGITYRPLACAIQIEGTISDSDIGLEMQGTVSDEDAKWLATGAVAEVVTDSPDAGAGLAGVVRSMTRRDKEVIATIGLDRPSPGLAVGQAATARIRVPLADREPFRSFPSGRPDLRKGEPRAAFVCADHPEIIRLAAGKCPKDRNTLEKVALASNQRLGWWCPMHPKVVAEAAGASCDECGGMKLEPRIITFRPSGEVLSVPESAVIDTGTKQVVFVESMPGLFDGVQVTLGPKCDGFYAVIGGLAPGQRVAASGAFLIDAETRLNPSLAASYFGANRAPAAEAAPKESPPSNLDFSKLSDSDRALAVEQKFCPVTGKPLGSMGSPVKQTIKGRIVFLCCGGCEGSLKREPDKYLSKLAPAAKAQP